jgi:hypothetical protein
VEDGGYWFLSAYNGHIFSSLFMPVAGYLQTISKLAGAISMLFPLEYAPFTFNLLAIFIKILPILFICSKRFNKIIPNPWVKIGLSLAYIALPNTAEIFVNITNTQWHLALLSILILIAEPAYNFKWKIFDYFFIALSCVSGPFCIFLVPAAGLRYLWSSKEERANLRSLYIVFILFTATQLIYLALNSDSSRMIQENRYNIGAFIKLITGQIYIASLIGQKGYSLFLSHLHNLNNLISNSIIVLVFTVGSAISIFSFLKGKKELKIFIIFCLTTFVFSLIRPMVPSNEALSQWQIMAMPGSATRYYFLPMIAFLVSAFSLINKKNIKPVKLIGILIIIIFVMRLQFDFFYKPWPNYHYQNQIQKLKQKSTGEYMEIQIVPEQYKIKLYKK